MQPHPLDHLELLLERIDMVLLVGQDLGEQVAADEVAHALAMRHGAFELLDGFDFEREALAQLKEAIAHCETVRDFVSRDLFARILANEEEHVDTLDKQFGMIERMGIQNYVALQSKPAEA